MMAQDYIGWSPPYVRPVSNAESPSQQHLMSGAISPPRSSASVRTPSPVHAFASRSNDNLLAPAPEASAHLARHLPGSDVPETVPIHREYFTAPDPQHATNSSLESFTAKEVLGDDNDLTFRPTILKHQCTIALVILYVLVGASIGVMWWRSGDDRQFRISSENVHMIARYFPSIVGTITVLFFHQTVREFIRMTPYINMADQHGVKPGATPWRSVSGAFFPWQDLFITAGFTPWLSVFCSTVASFIVSFKVALLATAQTEDGKWTLTVRTIPAVALMGAYILMAGYTANVGVRLKGKSTGLKWDPVSIADYIALFANCNALKYFEPLELRHETSAKTAMRSVEQRFRIGYWEKQKANGPAETVYGIGVAWLADSPPKDNLSHLKAPDPLMTGSDDDYDYPQRLSKKHYPYRHNPGFALWALILAAAIVYSALVVSVVALCKHWPMEGFKLANEWVIPAFQLTTTNHSIGLSMKQPDDPQSALLAYALLFRSLPTYAAVFFTNTIIPAIDLNMRFMQPFVSMFGEHRDASETVLLSYITTSPLEVPLEAYDNRHYKVSWFSALNTLSPLFPIFVGGLLIVTNDDDGKSVKVIFSLSAYIGVMAFLALYGFSFPWAWPNPHRLLPRQFYSLADLMAMCHESRFLSSPDLDIADKRRTPSKKHMEARILLNGARFLFGIYTGRDGKPHLGFDQAGTTDYKNYGHVSSTRIGNEADMVQWVEPKGRWHRWQWRQVVRGRELTTRLTTKTTKLEKGENWHARVNQSVFAVMARKVHRQEVERRNMIEMEPPRNRRLTIDPNAQASGTDAMSARRAGGAGRVDSLVMSPADDLAQATTSTTAPRRLQVRLAHRSDQGPTPLGRGV